MPSFPSLPDDAGVRHILQLHPAAGRALIDFHQAVLRTDTRLTAGDKELIAAYVSGLNECQYCHGVHAWTAAAFGLEPGTLEALLEDIDTAPIDDRMRPILKLARQLTIAPAKATPAMTAAAFEAGWSERDLHDAILTIGLFNLMNRLLEGHGVKGDAGLHEMRGKALKEEGYAPLLAHLK